MEKAKIDILLPYWGEFSLLKEAVDSVIAQTEQDWNLLIVDDCYPSLEAQKFYANHPDKRISYLRHDKNIGLVRNFNFVLDRASAEYCVIFGCDDVMRRDYISRALEQIGRADIYQPGVEIINDAGTQYLPMADRIKKIIRPRAGKILEGEKIVASLCTGNWLYFPSITWRVNTLKMHGFNETRPNTQDLSAVMDIISDGGKIYLDEHITFNYRRSSTSFSSKAKAGTRFEEEAKIYSEYATEFKNKGWNRAARAARLHLTSRLHRIVG